MKIKSLSFMYDGAGRDIEIGQPIYGTDKKTLYKVASIVEFGNQSEEWFFEIYNEEGELLKRLYGNRHLTVSFL